MYLSQKKNVKKWSDSEGFKDTSEWIVETDGMWMFMYLVVRIIVSFSILLFFQ